MKDRIPEDSDEFFDSPASSGDEFVPDVTSKSATDSEASIKCMPTSMAKHQL